MNCAYCKYNDGIVYTSIPPKYRCSITDEYHLALDDCNVEFAPVQHGRWEYVKKRLARGGYVGASECSVCHKIIMPHLEPNYCPNCGAKMDGKQNE